MKHQLQKARTAVFQACKNSTNLSYLASLKHGSCKETDNGITGTVIGKEYSYGGMGMEYVVARYSVNSVGQVVVEVLDLNKCVVETVHL